MAFIFGYAGGPDGYAPEEITFWWVAIADGLRRCPRCDPVAELSAVDGEVYRPKRGGSPGYPPSYSGKYRQFCLIPITADRVDSVLAEGLVHHSFLTRVLAGEG